KDDFKNLNIEWIEKYFTVEPHDLEQLDDPEGYILNNGGMIFFAKYGNEIVGTCALIKTDVTSYELAKMAVSPKYQGIGAGRKLGQTAIEAAKKLGATYLYLESNQKLTPALTLYKSLGFVEVPIGDTPFARANFKAEIHF
ncbi:MAG: GNAT family N-acetyltransferase, partial [Spirosomaceae bacterium]|nr:GNAT family N-acetyltransferase [Spirosomataceae bacterium]